MKAGPLALIAAAAGLLSTPAGLVELTTRPVGVWRELRRSMDPDEARMVAAAQKRVRRAERDLRTWNGGRL